ncbi:hypothetical protein KSP39_PZI023110 [Platanthera zijinensis]|uniref:Uncharacterized protein n=1 Tax=Platanthera zijinensis TaxID=2320716 RepID=A0AAP0FUX9_9ASPA
MRERGGGCSWRRDFGRGMKIGKEPAEQARYGKGGGGKEVVDTVGLGLIGKGNGKGFGLEAKSQERRHGGDWGGFSVHRRWRPADCNGKPSIPLVGRHVSLYIRGKPKWS